MSNTEALAKNFGVSAAIVNNILDNTPDREDLAVGSNGLTSGRDRTIEYAVAPRDALQWIQVSIRRNSPASLNTLSIGRPVYTSPTVIVWLPKDREMTTHVVDTYFTHLNLHRPVFERNEFGKILNEYYDGTAAAYDPGHICSVYLILALGTLSDLNHRAVRAELENKGEVIEHLGPEMAKKLMPPTWPQHDEFFERALAVKPDLRVTISSLQALILLHWYLYTEVSFSMSCSNTTHDTSASRKDSLAFGWQSRSSVYRIRPAPRPHDANRQLRWPTRRKQSSRAAKRIHGRRMSIANPAMEHRPHPRPGDVHITWAAACYLPFRHQHSPPHTTLGFHPQ
jgi:hypothetical protein